jgi:hypothetical protein
MQLCSDENRVKKTGALDLGWKLIADANAAKIVQGKY